MFGKDNWKFLFLFVFVLVAVSIFESPFTIMQITQNASFSTPSVIFTRFWMGVACVFLFSSVRLWNPQEDRLPRIGVKMILVRFFLKKKSLEKKQNTARLAFHQIEKGEKFQIMGGGGWKKCQSWKLFLLKQLLNINASGKIGTRSVLIGAKGVEAKRRPVDRSGREMLISRNKSVGKWIKLTVRTVLRLREKQGSRREIRGGVEFGERKGRVDFARLKTLSNAPICFYPRKNELWRMMWSQEYAIGHLGLNGNPWQLRICTRLPSCKFPGLKAETHSTFFRNDKGDAKVEKMGLVCGHSM